MGTGSFADKSLRKLCETGREVVGVFTKHDTAKGRGMKLIEDVVKQTAKENGIPVFQPEKLKTGEALTDLTALSPDIVVVVSYGKILPAEILAVPPLGCVNIHGSLLPKYRGAAPVQWSVINGDRETGVTSMYMDVGMDTGDIIMTKKTAIGERETAGELYERLGLLGAELLAETLDAIERGTAGRRKQDGGLATYAPMLTKALSPIDWNADARAVVSRVRGLCPWPAATAEIGGAALKIYAAELLPDLSGSPGSVVFADKRGIAVACKGGAVLLTEVQAPGGRRMSSADYLRGHPLCP